MSGPKPSLSELANRIASGETSSVEAVTACLERIRQIEPWIHAWAALDADNALDTAAECDADRRMGRLRGPLHGVPVGVKDIFDTAGLATGMGSPSYEGNVPNQDAEAVRRLKNAGAIVLGKTVTAEFATLDPGPTRNPWNTEHTPGGSSSGSAAAVAAGMCPGATGTQTAASIGRPAAFCGVTGFVPTEARIPRTGVFPAAWSLDHVGGFGRGVDDVKLLVEVMAAMPFDSDPAETPRRVGVVVGYFQTNSDPEAWKIHESLTRRLAENGLDVVALDLPSGFEDAATALPTLMRSELAVVHREHYAEHRDRLGPQLRELIEDGLRMRAIDYVRAQRIRKTCRHDLLQLFRRCDVLLSPGATGPAPRGIETTGNPAMSIPWTFADCPTLSLPAGLAPSGLPLGIQLSAAPSEEARLLRIGRQIEQAIGFEEHPPI